MGGLSIHSDSWLFHWVYTPPTSYSSSHPWRLMSVSSSQCYQVTLSNVPIRLKIVFAKSLLVVQSFVPIPCVSVLLWSLHHYPCFVSIYEGYINAFLRQISACQLQHIIWEWDLESCHFCGTLEAIFIIDGFSRGCWWFTLLTSNQSISLMFDIIIIYSHEMKCIGSMASKTLGY